MKPNTLFVVKKDDLISHASFKVGRDGVFLCTEVFYDSCSGLFTTMILTHEGLFKVEHYNRVFLEDRIEIIK